MRIIRFIFFLVCLFPTALYAGAAEVPLEKVLPSPACAPGWILDEKVILYNKDTLFDRIDGEAELYFPYGFEMLASARYASEENPKIAVDADVYKMGSLLDAYGMFANYRKKDDAEIRIGAEGTVSSSQLFFYQGKYLVRLQATGTTDLTQDVFRACAGAITRLLPPDAGRPKELELLAIPAVVRKSERYIAQSLLGYEFFHRGLIADAIVHNEVAQVFIVLEDSPDAALKAFGRYRESLQAADKHIRVTAKQGRTSMSAVDALYGNVQIEQVGRYLVGVIRFKDAASARQLLDQLNQRLGV